MSFTEELQHALLLRDVYTADTSVTYSHIYNCQDLLSLCLLPLYQLGFNVCRLYVWEYFAGLGSAT